MIKQEHKITLRNLYSVNQRVKTIPHTFLWLQGHYTGTITSIGNKYLYIKFDDEESHHLPRAVLPDNLTIEGDPTC